ncbi:GNAT family N-acetyltransferase [Fischerella sp. JS2]|uniref:GNAT family N-acetyltransferase n=1 Tax=Fischerella sp. JS2 TaxID=2597771 RepID=UPI0028ED6C6A|nr:GNAT family N-acetyltransferase [Fischerella sp. JS2]
MLVEVTTWYLEMLNPKQLHSVSSGNYELRIEQAKIPSPEFSRFLYTSVGGDWYWIDRLSWNYQRWLSYLSRPELETWVAYVSGTPAGYVELGVQADNNVEITYFGILRQFIGQRLGGHLLSFGVERAWAIGAKRVWVHTCSLDGPYALANYQARGFQIYKQAEHTLEIPDKPMGAWSGAND